MSMLSYVLSRVFVDKNKLQEKAIEVFNADTNLRFEYIQSEKKDTRYVFELNIVKNADKYERKKIFYNKIAIELGEIEVVINIYAEKQKSEKMKDFDSFVRYAEKIITNALKRGLNEI